LEKSSGCAAYSSAFANGSVPSSLPISVVPSATPFRRSTMIVVLMHGLYPNTLLPATYRHTQRAPLCLLLSTLAVPFLVLAGALGNEPVLPYVFLPVGLLMLVPNCIVPSPDRGGRGRPACDPIWPGAAVSTDGLLRGHQERRSGRTMTLDGWGIRLSRRLSLEPLGPRLCGTEASQGQAVRWDR
jgi:hypothetical protein